MKKNKKKGISSTVSKTSSDTTSGKEPMSRRKEDKMDMKERSKERKKMIEENRGKTDKKAHAMNLLKARREERKERGMSFLYNIWILPA